MSGFAAGGNSQIGNTLESDIGNTFWGFVLKATVRCRGKTKVLSI